MKFLEIAKRRYSVREFSGEPVEEEKLALILEAGRVAPTAANYQPQRILVVRSAEGMEKIGRVAFMYDAPVALVVCVEGGAVWRRPFDDKLSGDIDASIVATHMMLQATEVGLGTAWICYFRPEALRSELSIPAGWEPVTILAIGYAKGEALSPDRHDEARLPLSRTVFYETR